MNNSGDYYPYYTNYGEDDGNSSGGSGCGGSFIFLLLVVLGIIELLSKIF